MIKEESIEVKVPFKNKRYYEMIIGSKLSIGDTIIVSIKDIPNGSSIIVTGICDFCFSEKKISIKNYNRQTNNKKIKFACSKSCVILKTKETNINKYGIDNVSKIQDVKERISRKKYELYGNVNFNNREKCKNTNLNKYGYEFASSSDIVKEKVRITNLEKFGEEYPSKNKDIIDKMKLSNLTKFGVDNYSKTKEFSDKIKQKWFITMYSKLEIYGKLKESNYGKYTIDCLNCGEEFSILDSLMNKRINNSENICLNCNPISCGISKMEKSLLYYIRDNYTNDIIENSRKEIGLELDIYIPDLKLAFEFNGLYWHSELYKDRLYHLNKTKECLEKGIQLIHIWEDDWIYKQDIVKSVIVNKLGKSEKIYARKCDIKEVKDNKLVRKFLEINHIQGFVGSKTKLGLFYNNELVSLMTFGNIRKSLGQKSQEGHYELLRFCNKLNTTVVGGPSRLLRYFVINYNPEQIISYSDISRSNGNMYQKLGFKLCHNSSPNYYYIIDGVRRHRFNFRKDKLIKEGNDKNKTEIQIMMEKGYYRIFDCGMQKWILK